MGNSESELLFVDEEVGLVGERTFGRVQLFKNVGNYRNHVVAGDFGLLGFKLLEEFGYRHGLSEQVLLHSLLRDPLRPITNNIIIPQFDARNV
jgi:hypothetical protein